MAPQWATLWTARETGEEGSSGSVTSWRHRPAAVDTLLNLYAPAFARSLKPGGRVVLFKNWALAEPAPFRSRAAVLGMSGARLTLTILHELRRRKGRYGLAAACIGGGQGIAVVVEAY